MAAAIALRSDFDGAALRRLGRLTKDAAQARRLLALAAVRDGGSRSDAADRRCRSADHGRHRRARGPIPAIREAVRWRLADLAHWIWEEFGISFSETTVGRELRALGYRKISARPRHYAQNELAIDDFKKDLRPSWTRSAKGSRPEPR